MRRNEEKRTNATLPPAPTHPPTGPATRTATALFVLLLVALTSAGSVLAKDPPTARGPVLPLIVARGTTLMNAETWQPFEVRGVNYLRPTMLKSETCPDLRFDLNSECPWDREAITADMEHLQARGVNTIRVFLNYYAFGGGRADHPRYDIETPLDRLEELITIANQHHIYVIPVLLAKYPQDTHFDPEDLWHAMDAHVRPVVERFANHSGILAWDLFNEPDIAGPVDVRCWDWDNREFPLCFNLATQRLLFLNMLRDEVRRMDPHRLLTVSVAFAKSYFRPSDAYYARLADLVDFFSFHYYDNAPYDSGRYAQHWYYGEGFPRDLERSIDELHALSLNKVIVVTEVGFPSNEGNRQLQDVQRDLRTVLQLARNKQVSGIVLWPFQEEPEHLIHDLFW
ncbi:MAG: glycoside hydrolase family 5 protein [Chloroflexaceae bacterium]|nr:glycoside hydrolase family 5 protein [Chloroflexaceae bacterium]